VGCPYSRSFSVSFICDPDYNEVGHQREVSEDVVCQYHVEVKTAYGCPAQCKRGANGLLCSGQGTCGYSQEQKQAMCLCDSGFIGADCSEKGGCGAVGCGGTAAGGVLGTAAAVGLAGFVFVKRGGRLPVMGGSGGATSGATSTGTAQPALLGEEYSQL
jgi:hypothetical protein